MRRRHVAGIALMLATVAPGCSNDEDGSAAATSVAPAPTSSSATSSAVSRAVPTTERTRPPDELLADVAWPPDYSVIAITGTADDQLLALINEDTRVSPFVLDSEAVGLGRANSTVGAVLAVQVSPAAAVDPEFRASLAAGLLGDSGPAEAQVWDGDELTAVWLGSTVVVVAVSDDAAREEIAALLLAAGGP